MPRITCCWRTLVPISIAGAIITIPAGGAAPKKPASPYAAQITALHEVKNLLASADRDYKGHRQTAVNEVTGAIQALQAGYAYVPFAKPTAKPGNDPQEVSDKKLSEAVAQLEAVHKQLKQAQGSAAPTAAAALDKAISELRTALKIK